MKDLSLSRSLFGSMSAVFPFIRCCLEGFAGSTTFTVVEKLLGIFPVRQAHYTPIEP
jgi:hypothetical protein